MAGHGRSKVEADNVTTASDLGLRRDEIHEARKIRDAEKSGMPKKFSMSHWQTNSAVNDTKEEANESTYSRKDKQFFGFLFHSGKATRQKGKVDAHR